MIFFSIIAKAQDGEKGTGLIFLDEQEYSEIPLATTAMMGSLPLSKDLSNWFPVPGNQGGQGSCVAWAVGYALKFYQEAVERRQSVSQALTFSPAYIYNQIKINGCENGSDIKVALNLLKSEGVCPMSQFPYDSNNCHRIPSSMDKNSARPYTIAEWRKVSLDNEAEIKSHIASGFPVVIGMYVDDGFKELYGDNIYRGPSGAERGGHAMVVTGYDDSKGAFKVINSWGTNWGNGGFGWISYQAFKQRVREAYSAQDVVINDPNNVTNVNPNPVPNLPVSIPTVNVTAAIMSPLVTHNIMVNTVNGPYLGMMITVPWSVYNGLNATAQIVVRFYNAMGHPLLANVSEQSYRDINGVAATGTAAFQIIYNASTSNAQVYLPYYALNFPATNGAMQYNVNAVATIYVNQFEKAQSQMTPMIIRY